ncbi:hypothetical protein HC928_09585 [bacterium]|nr:hypothetical protein [bacterium]
MADQRHNHRGIPPSGRDRFIPGPVLPGGNGRHDPDVDCASLSPGDAGAGELCVRYPGDPARGDKEQTK